MKSNYLNELEREFYFVSDEEREQIIAEYAVHFEERIKEGATEAEIISSMGSPKQVAIEYATELDINYSSFSKYIANTKRDSNIFYHSLKKKFTEIKREEALKRQNLKNYANNVNADSGQNPDGDITRTNNNVGKRTLNGFFEVCVKIFYVIKVLITYFMKFIYLILGFAFTISTLPILAMMIIAPIGFTFINYGLQFWFIFYLGSFSAIVFCGTCTYICYKLFERR